MKCPECGKTFYWNIAGQPQPICQNCAEGVED